MTQTTPKDATSLELEEVPCDYCGSEAADVVLTGRDRLCGLPGRFQVVVCRACGLARTNPRPTAASLVSAYPQYEPHQAEVRPGGPPTGFLRWALVNLRNYPLGQRAPAPVRWLLWPWAAVRLRNRKHVGYLAHEGEGHLLDFGCGVGKYIAQMAASGWQAEGIDLVPEAVRVGRQAGLPIHVGTLPGADLPTDHYDLITMWHALEHVPSPMATLKAARVLLRSGGRLGVVCPLSDALAARWFGSTWYGLDLPRHLTHFTRATLKRHLKAAGFKVERMHTIRRPTFVRRSFGYLAEETGKPLHRRLARSHALARLLSHAGLLVRRTDEMLFVARRV